MQNGSLKCHNIIINKPATLCGYHAFVFFFWFSADWTKKYASMSIYIFAIVLKCFILMIYFRSLLHGGQNKYYDIVK